jgi:hypothetical protein
MEEIIVGATIMLVGVIFGAVIGFGAARSGEDKK